MRRLHITLLGVLAMPMLLGLPPAGAQEHGSAIFLVARPGLPDPNFHESVVLVTQDAQNSTSGTSAGETLGVIINRPTDRSLASILPGDRFARYVEPVFFGGPVMKQGLFALYRAGEPIQNSVTMLSGIHLALQASTLDALMRTPPQSIRFYAGLCGWAPGQLQAEIQRGDWFVLNADAETVFARDAENKGMWRRLFRMARTITAGIAPRRGGGPSLSAAD